MTAEEKELGLIPLKPQSGADDDLGLVPETTDDDLGLVPEDPGWIRQRRNEYERGVAQAMGMGSTAALLWKQKKLDQEQDLADLDEVSRVRYLELIGGLERDRARITPEEYQARRTRYRDVVLAQQAKRTTPERQALAHAANVEDLKQGMEESAAGIAGAQQTVAEIPTSAAMREFQQAKGVGGVLGAVARNPVAAPLDLMTGSLPAALPGMAAGAVMGSQAGPAGTAAGAGLGSFAPEYLGKVLEVAQEMGVDVQNPDELVKFFNDPAKLGEASGLAIRKGVPVAALDALTGGMAGKFLQGALGKGWKQIVKASAKETGVQVAGGMTGEAAGELAAGEELSAQNILAEGIAELPGGVQEVATNVRAERKAAGKPTLSWPPQAPTLEPMAPAEKVSGGKPEERMAAAPAEGLAGAASSPSMDDVLAGAMKAQQAEAEARAKQEAERAERQAEAAAKREQFAGVLTAAQGFAADPAASYAQLQGARAQLETYLDDNSLGLTSEQRASATATLQRVAPRLRQLQAAQEAETAQREAEARAAEETRQAEAAAAARAERQRIQQLERTGRDPQTRKIVQLERVPSAELERIVHGTQAEIAAEGLTAEQIGQELYRREVDEERSRAQDAEGTDELLSVLKSVKLPARDSALGAELEQLIAEEMGTVERKRYVSNTKSGGLDAVAEVLREDFGFADIKTPADVIEQVQRALRGAKIRSTGTRRVEQAATDGWSQIDTASESVAPRAMPPEQRARLWNEFRGAFPELAQEVDVEIATTDREYAEAMRNRGVDISDEHAAGTQAVMIPREVIARHRAARARKDAIVFSARAWANRRLGSSRAVHEVAHVFWWALPEQTREVLQELHAQEIESRTGPLFDESLPAEQRTVRTDLRYVTDLDTRGLHEWFAERIARMNEAWAEGRLDVAGRGKLGRAQLALRDAWEQVKELLQRAFEAFVRARGQDPESEFWQREFRRFMLGGARQNRRTERRATAYAEGKRVEFAANEGAPRTAEFAEPATPSARLKELQEKRLAARQAQQKSRTDFEGHDAERARYQKQLDDIVAGDAADKEIAGRTAEQEMRAAEKRALDARKIANESQYEAERLEQEIEREKLTADGLAAKVIPPGTPERRRAALFDVREKLTERLALAKRSLHDAAGFAIRGELLEIETVLDKEFPGWREHGARTVDEKPGEPPAILDERRPEDGQQDPQQEATEYPVRTERFDEVEGQSIIPPSGVERAWSYVREKLVRGFKGAIPELPTFPAAWWNKADGFLKGNPQFYNRLREGWRMLKRATPEVLKSAEEQTARIVRPLLAAGRKAGLKFDANAYARLQRLQAQRRTLIEDGKKPGAAMLAEIHALNSQFENDPYVLFSRLVMYLDFQWRWQNLKSDRDEPITLPGGLNIAEIEQRIAELKAKVQAGGWAEPVAKALSEHIALVRQVADELKERELWPQQALTNPFYFPHIVVEKSTGALERVKIETAEDFRGYLLNPVGSNKPIESDYTKAMYYHLVQVGAHNRRADIVRNYFQSYDVMEQVRKRAKALGAERGNSVSWRQAFHEEFAGDGYVLFSADPGKGLMPALTVDRDKLAHRIGAMIGDGDIQAELAKLGVRGIRIQPEDVRESLMAGEKEYWVVPEKVAEALRGMIGREREQPGAWSRGLAKLQGLWKAWTLFAPWNYIRYEYGNTLADLEKLFSADPKVFTLLPRAAKEVHAFLSGKGAVTPEVREAFRLGVMNSVTAEEIGALPDLQQFAELATDKQKVWNWIRTHNTTQVSQLREATFRYAKFLADLDRLKNGARPVYAGAYWKDIDAIRESKPGAGDANALKAAQISLSTFGDYGDMSVAGQEMRQKLVPFYSWMEINLKYHANLFRNLRDAVAAHETSRAEAAKAGARAGAVFAAGMGRRAAGMFLTRLALPYLAVLAWNHSGDNGDIEDELSEEDKRRFHIVVGRDANGKAQVIYAPTAFADVLKWISGPEFARVATEYLKGNTDLATALSQWGDRIVPDFINNTVGSFGPLVKTPVMTATRKQFFPDVTEPKTIPAYDFRRAILASITDQTTADWIERALNKDYLSDKDAGTWAMQAVLQVRARDAQAWAFYAIKDKANEFLEARTGQKRDSSYDAPDQQVLRNFRRSLYRGDVENALRFYNRLLEYGYTADRFRASLRAQDPLAVLPRDVRKEFVQSLAPHERAQLDRAYEFYAKMRAFKGDERRLFPRQGKNDRQTEALRRGFRPRPDLLAAEIDGLSDEEIERNARRALAEALRPGRN